MTFVTFSYPAIETWITAGLLVLLALLLVVLVAAILLAHRGFGKRL